MRQFDLLALFGVIAFSGSGFFINKAEARSLAEVTLEAESPFGPGWLLAGSQPASELDDETDPIDYGPIASSAPDNDDDDAPAHHRNSTHRHGHGPYIHRHGHGPYNHTHDEEEVEEEDDQVGAGNPNAGGTGDENPFQYLEEMFQNLTDSIDDLEGRVADLAELQIQLTDLQESHDALSTDIQDQLDRIDALEVRIEDLETNHVKDCLDEIQANGVYVSDRWRIYQSSNNDLLVRDTVSNGNPSYRFTAGGRDTFGASD